MRQNAPRKDIEDRREIDETASHRHVANVRRPDLVRPVDRHPTQQILINLVSGRRLARVGPAIDRLDPHPLNQRRHISPAYDDAFAPQQIPQHPCARKGMIEMQFIEPAHYIQIHGQDRPRRAVVLTEGDAQSLRLPGDRKIVIAVDHLFAPSNPVLESAPE